MNGKGEVQATKKAKGKREAREILAILAAIAEEYADDYEAIGKVKVGAHGRSGQSTIDYEGGIDYWD